MSSQETRLMTARQTADYLSVSLPCLYQWCKQRKVPHIVLNIGVRKECLRFKRSAIDAWIEAHQREPKGFSKWDKR